MIAYPEFRVVVTYTDIETKTPTLEAAQDEADRLMSEGLSPADIRIERREVMVSSWSTHTEEPAE